MLKFTAALNFLLLSLLTLPAAAIDTTSAVAALTAQLKNMQSLNAKFTQQIIDAKGVQLQTAEGNFSVKRPRRFYWRTETPYQHLVVTDGIEMWLYDIDLEQASKQAFSSELDKAPALLLSGEVEEISNQYHVEQLSVDNGVTTFKLTPKLDVGVFRELTISFSGEDLTAMSFRDSFDQSTQIQFNDVKLNLVIDDSRFKFTPPDGIDVIDHGAVTNTVNK